MSEDNIIQNNDGEDSSNQPAESTISSADKLPETEILPIEDTPASSKEVSEETATEPASTPTPSSGSVPQPESLLTNPIPTTQNVSEKFSENMGRWKEHLAEALAGKEKKKQKNILVILELAQRHEGVVKNEQVQKALRCTQLTAYRYLSFLEKQGRLKRIGGHNTPTYRLV